MICEATVANLCWKISKHNVRAGVAAPQAMRCSTAVVRKAFSLPVELLGFFGNLYLHSILFCNASKSVSLG